MHRELQIRERKQGSEGWTGPEQDLPIPGRARKGPEGRCEGPRPPPGAASGRGGPGWAEDPLEYPGSAETQWRPRPPFWIVPPPCLPAPRQDLLPERVEDNGTGRPPARLRPRRQPDTGYRGHARRGEPRDEQMAADGAQGQSLPKHCERVWRQQRERRREAAFTSGSKLASASLLPGRQGARAGSRKQVSSHARARTLRDWLCRTPT